MRSRCFYFKRYFVLLIFVVLGLKPALAQTEDGLDLARYVQEKLEHTDVSPILALVYFQNNLHKIETEGQRILFQMVVDKLAVIYSAGYRNQIEELYGSDLDAQILSFQSRMLAGFLDVIPYSKTKLQGQTWGTLITQGPESFLGSKNGKGDFAKVWNILESSCEIGNDSAFHAVAALIQRYSRQKNIGVLRHVGAGARHIRNQVQLDFFQAVMGSANYRDFAENPEGYLGIHNLIPKVNAKNIYILKHAVAMNSQLWAKRGYPAASLKHYTRSIGQEILFLENLLNYSIEIQDSIQSLDKSVRKAKEAALVKLLTYMPNFYFKIDRNPQGLESRIHIKVVQRLHESLFFLKLVKRIVDGVNSQAMVNDIDYLFDMKLQLVAENGYRFNRVEVNLVSEALLESFLSPNRDQGKSVFLLPETMNPISIENLGRLNKKVSLSSIIEENKPSGIISFCRDAFEG